MPQNFDWSQLAQLIPQLLMQIRGNAVGAAGFAEGFAKGRLLKQQEEERAQRMDIQQQQEQRQGEYQHELITDRQRQRELDTQQEERLRIGAARTGAQTALKAAGEAPDVETGERNLQASLAEISDLYGMKPGAFDQTLTQVKPLIAKRTLTEYEKRIEALKKDYPGGLKTLWDTNQSITMGGGRPPVKFRNMVQAVGGMAINEDGDVTFPTSAGTSMEGQDLTAYARSIGKTVQQLTYQDRMDFRKSRALSDDKPPDPASGAIKDLQRQMLERDLRDRDEKAKETDIQKRLQAETISEFNSVMLDSVNRLLTKDEQLTPGAQWLVGKSGWAQPQVVRGSGARDAQAALARIKSNRIVQLISQMKAQSRTGATGFGQLNERELDVIESASSRLDTGQSEEAFREALLEIKRLVEKSMQGAQMDRNRGLGVNPNVKTPPDFAPPEPAATPSGNPFRH